jgi:Protein of unknown function (DUF2799)
MRYLSAIISGLVVAGMLYGCATLSRDQCLQADWHELGYRDGSMGSPRSLFQKHYDACLEHGVQAERDVYFAGRQEGLAVYCTYDSGFSQGRSGNRYQHVCPAELESEFSAGYARGHEIYEYESQVASLEQRLRSLEGKIQDKEKRLTTSDLTRQEREKIRTDIQYLDLEYRDAVRELRYLEKTRPVGSESGLHPGI